MDSEKGYIVVLTLMNEIIFEITTSVRFVATDCKDKALGVAIRETLGGKYPYEDGYTLLCHIVTENQFTMHDESESTLDESREENQPTTVPRGREE
jgi:hypothetical protein